MADSARLAVLGSPIAHSKSPALHGAAYEALGLDWSYTFTDLQPGELVGFLAKLGPEWRGLSVTMPLKQTAFALMASVDRIAEVTGAVNTVLLDPTGRAHQGFNTDVGGIVRAAGAAHVHSARIVQILGGGATAGSALAAAAELGAEQVLVRARSLSRAVWLEPLAHSLGLTISIRPLSQPSDEHPAPDLVISTLPGGAELPPAFDPVVRAGAPLLDVAYDPWPSPLGQHWAAAGGTIISGLAMLAEQALLQVRIFTSGDPFQPLPDEERVHAAMCAAVGLPAASVPAAAGGASPRAMPES